MSDQTPLDVEAIRARLDAATFTAEITFDNRGGDGEFFRHAPTDLRRLLDENARLNAENGRYLRIISETTADNAGLTACLDAVHRVAEQPDRDWQRLSERMPEYFKPVDAEERARRTGWNQGVALFRDQLRAALETSGMPRPAAEETQERPETPGTGSGRGTGVAEASGTAQAGDLLDDLTPWGYEPLTPRQVDAAKRALRPVHYREAAASIRALADDPVWAWGPAHREGMHHAADHLDAVACDEAPSLPVEEGP